MGSFTTLATDEIVSIEPAKPWQLWSLGALARASARAATFERERPNATGLDAELTALAAAVV